MNLKINGFELTDVSVEEALQLIKPTEQRVVSHKVIDLTKPKRTYHKKVKYIKWTDDDKLIVLDNIKATPRVIWKLIDKRHTLGAVCFMRRTLKLKFNL